MQPASAQKSGQDTGHGTPDLTEVPQILGIGRQSVHLCSSLSSVNSESVSGERRILQCLQAVQGLLEANH
ncbi:hypothetical protein N7510_000140 [Penicillium lagena]|uniref:uncharacterized protein n=1 Tax=Penicillium lagena TaxID=94218 RepID=UPI002541E8A1|nr:uncharacterized protein N7510_000140 [Penicillium lagena]KAJ5623831.1 hypothetical protein N7510_000140 [Penicillium lagena]